MELCLHIRRTSDVNRLGAVNGHLMGLYEDRLKETDGLPTAARIYVGDEFCPLRLPGKNALERFCRIAQERRIGLTLLTPVLTDLWLDRCRQMFEALDRGVPSAEVVVNDLGTLLHLKQQFPQFELSMGRLFNKGFKDPRLDKKDAPLTPEIEALLSESSFDHPEFKSILAEFELSRVERDLMPHASYLPAEDAHYQTSYYFPYGYVTTGRVCWTATFAKNGAEDYKPMAQCARPCESLTFDMQSDTAASIRLLQSGNTIFYQYTPDRLSDLMEQAIQGRDRLIYQGWSL